jgi:hypothetical protein
VTASLASLTATEVRVQTRHHVGVAAAVMTVLWVPLLLVLPRPWRAEALAWILLLDVATLGLFFAPALAVVERGNGVTAALQVTRLSPAVAVTVRVLVLTTWAVAAAAVLLALVRVPAWPTVLIGAALTTALLALLALVAVGRATTLTRYLGRVPLIAAPLFVPALLHGIGLVDSPWLAVSPVTGAVELLRGEWSVLHASWLLIATVVLWLLVVRLGFEVAPDEAVNVRRRPRLAAFAGAGWRRATRSFAVADARTLLGDRLLVLLLAGIPLIAVAVRLASTVGVTWLDDQYGVDASPHLPAVWAFVLVLHIPLMVGTLTGLLFLEDRDAGLLPAVATTRASLATLFAYRLVVTGVVAGVLVAATTLVAGATHPAGWRGLSWTVVAGAVVATVPAALLATLARDRVQGTALMKVMGLPLYAPIAWWFVEAPVGWAFALVPTAWAARTFWATGPLEAAGFAAGAVVTSAVGVALLLRRLRRSIVGH